ncbi:hypothetical protein BKA56DRAFT_621049 [Ilyonectria sp. MPI-CAGE-AT-0026]|nr:hypothetical protein BKA56DRAFT_621049 [Ilyonectria sp. MPI-CAGE-AT-0026]
MFSLVFFGVQNMLTGCIARDKALDPSLCDEKCHSNPANLVCVVSSLFKAAFTYYGQTGRDFATTILSNDELTPTNTGESGNIGAETSGESNTNESESRDSGSNTGAIVGGVVGGLAVVSLLVLGVLFLRRPPYKQRVANSEPSPSDPVGHFAITCG